MKKWIIILLSLVLTMVGAIPAIAEENKQNKGQIITQVADFDEFGNLILGVSTTDILNQGINIGDIAAVTLNEKAYDMPVVANYSDVDQGALLCRLIYNTDKEQDYAVLGINMGNLAVWAELAFRENIDEAPGYRWTLNEGIPDPIPVTLVLKEKGGYDEQLPLHQLERSDKREDYPNLDDAAYANFREITTTGMGKNVLYRSSSPVNPKMNRNKESDAACRTAGIKTFINLADSEEVMRSYEGFEESYYSTEQIICLNMVVDFQSEEFKESLASGFTFMAGQESPFLIHCTEGKDRAGFASAVLEAFMGASADEIIQDYMVSYYNYYGVEPGSEMYTKIAEANICKSLSGAFGLISLEGADLKQTAETYLREIGLPDETIAALREKLS